MTTLKPPTEEMISPVMSHMMVKDEGSQTRLPKISIQEISRLSSATRFEDEKHESIENFEPEEVVSKVTTLFSGEDVHSVRSSDEAEMAQQCLSSVEWIFDTSTTDVGAIDLAFPENLDPKFKEVECLPLSYFTLNAKERLLLAFAENFRRQFVVSPEYAGRRPLVLAPKNECGVQKFVCTTIKPTPFLIPKLIGSWEECASFVADFIIYEPLENPLQLPPRLISPDTLLRQRRGNCYEMATLLCSMLTGAGFAAMVVSGCATIETTLNDQRRVPCPFVPEDPVLEPESPAPMNKNKYELRGPPDLRSKFMVELEEKALQKELEEEERRLQEERDKSEELAKRPPDRFFGRRMHAWVAIIENAPWCYKPRPKVYNDEGEEIIPDPTAFFIEPSTGFRHETSSPKYLRIESIWNQHNYYINRQEPTENLLADMRWDLKNTDHWEHFLPAEPFELRVGESRDQDLEPGNQATLLVEKHLDILPSWVQKLRISLKDFESRFPNEEKSIYYKKALYQRYAPYFCYDGLMKRLTIFGDLDYQKPLKRWEWYENRMDYLNLIKIDFETKQIEESFIQGRKDCLKYFSHNAEPHQPKTFYFFDHPRLDCLRMMQVMPEKYVFHYNNREDLCYYQEFQTKPKERIRCHAKSLMEITEKFNRNEKVPVNKDIAIRQFQLTHGKIFLQFQYAADAITASTREFLKPPKPDYGEEIIFDPLQTNGYNANPLENPPTQAELYFLLLDQLKREETLKKIFEKRCTEYEELLNRRKNEMLNPRLEFSVFDPLRNEGARRIRLEEYEEERIRKEIAKLQDPDFLAPYLVLYERRKPNFEESWAAYNACLSDLKSRYTNLLNELQRRYEDLTSEARALKKFMSRFQDQFDDFDYDRLIKEAKNIELNKRMVQQRLILTHEEAQRKYEKVKESLLGDERLHLRKAAAFN